MVDSAFTGSVLVVGQVAAGGFDGRFLPQQPVVLDARGQGEHSLADAANTSAAM